jgi:hypothetical protein
MTTATHENEDEEEPTHSDVTGDKKRLSPGDLIRARGRYYIPNVRTRADTAVEVVVLGESPGLVVAVKVSDNEMLEIGFDRDCYILFPSCIGWLYEKLAEAML